MRQAEPHARVSLRAKVVSLLVSLTISGALAEGLVRSIDGGAFPRLRLFVEDARVGIALRAFATTQVSRKGGAWSMATGDDGVRVTPNLGGDAWIVVGDSQALGFGVEDGQTFAARATAAGVPMLSAGVPGYGVEDSLRRASTFLARRPARGIVVVVNQANDWEEIGSTVESRYRVVGGWLMNASSATTVRARLLGSNLTRLHLFYHAMQPFAGEQPSAKVPVPRWLAQPDSEVRTTQAVAAAIAQFAEAHPGVPLVVCFLPVDCATSAERAMSSPFREPMLRVRAEPWRERTLRDQLRAALGSRELVDLTPALTAPANFLANDYHLSPRGHAGVAALLVRHISKGGRA